MDAEHESQLIGHLCHSAVNHQQRCSHTFCSQFIETRQRIRGVRIDLFRHFGNHDVQLCHTTVNRSATAN